MEHQIAELAGAKLLAGLPPDKLRPLATVSRRLELDAGQGLFAQGDPADAFFLLVRGEVRVYKLLRDGRVATLRHVRPGDSFAESALSVDRYPAYTETTAPSVVYRVPVDDLRTLLLQDPELAVALLGRMAELLSLLNRRVEELLLPVPARLARYLLDLCDRQPAPSGAADDGPRTCRLPTTKRDLAARLGTVPETLSRAFGGLKRAGVVRLSHNGEVVELLDPDALLRIAHY